MQKILEKILLIIPLHNKAEFLVNSLKSFKPEKEMDILIIDDASTDETFESIPDDNWVKCIKKEMELGYGALFITGLEYALDMDYEYVIFIDPESDDFSLEIPSILENLKYGYDIVSSSRILESFHYREIPENYIEITRGISERINEVTGFDLTDPLSRIKAFRVKALKEMNLTDFSDGILLQLWIQAAHFGLTIHEIPSQSDNIYGVFGTELDEYEDPLGFFLALIETENYLYKKGSVN